MDAKVEAIMDEVKIYSSLHTESWLKTVQQG
jgi:hypothetical protein